MARTNFLEEMTEDQRSLERLFRSGIRPIPEHQKEEWRKQRKQQEEQMKELVRDLAASWQENPETIAEAVSFGSRMYKYSVRNNMLIYKQNTYAT